MASRNSAKPNIVFILSDDQGPWAMHCAGNDDIITPNLDRMAAGGTRFENFFCTSPVCSPARASILTGKIPSQHGVQDFLSRGCIGEPRIEYLAGHKGYTDYLAENGYQCALSGKWHLGDSLKPQMSMTHWYAHQIGAGPYYNAPMVRDGKCFNEPGYITDRITDDAIAYLQESVKQDTPFCLNVHYTAPHVPWLKDQHPQEIWNLYKDCEFKSLPQEPYHPNTLMRFEPQYIPEMLTGYFTAITAMDLNIGRILDTLEELDLQNNTLVAFMSDNGHCCGQHGLWGKGNCTIPANMYEESIKVPSIFYQPGTVPAGVVRQELVSQYDFLPTILDYVGLPQPEDKDLPGQSFAPLIRSDREASAYHDHVYIYDEYGAVRMVRTQKWKYVHRYPLGPHELYDLENDPGERNNLVERSEYAEVVAEFALKIRKWFARYVDPDIDGIYEANKGCGQLDLVGTKNPGNQAFAQIRRVVTNPIEHWRNCERQLTGSGIME